MLPSSEVRFHASVWHLGLGLLVASGLVVVFTLTIDDLRSDLVLVIIAGLISLLSLGIVVEILMYFLTGPRGYVVDAAGLRFGRGTRLTQLFEWHEVISWTDSSTIQGGRRWKFETDEKIFTVRASDVAIPSVEAFAREVEERTGRPPA